MTLLPPFHQSQRIDEDMEAEITCETGGGASEAEARHRLIPARPRRYDLDTLPVKASEALRPSIALHLGTRLRPLRSVGNQPAAAIARSATKHSTNTAAASVASPTTSVREKSNSAMFVRQIPNLSGLLEGHTNTKKNKND